MMTRLIFLILISGFFSAAAKGQWYPSGVLASVPVIEDCSRTRGDIAVAHILPVRVIYYCQAMVNRLEQAYPGASHFYYVHEFGHQARSDGNEPGADCWAADQLARARNGRQILESAIRHFWDRGSEYHPSYGSGYDRARRLQSCGSTAFRALGPASPGLLSPEKLAASDFSQRLLSPATATISDEFSKLLDLSNSQFISLRGSLDETGSTSFFDRYISLMKLEGFDACWVYPSRIGAPSASYRCDMKVQGSDVSERFAQVVGSIRFVKPKEWAEADEPGEMTYLATEGEGKRSVAVRVDDREAGIKTISVWFSAGVPADQ